MLLTGLRNISLSLAIDILSRKESMFYSVVNIVSIGNLLPVSSFHEVQ